MTEEPAATAAPIEYPIAQALWDAPDVGTIMVDRDLRIHGINACAAHILGGAGASPPTDLATLIRPEDATRLSSVAGQHPTPAGPHLLRAASVEDAGTAIPAALLVTAVAVRDPNTSDDLILLVGRSAARDILREARVRRAARLEVVGQLAQAIGHDLNNALGTITTLADLLLADAEPDSDVAADLTDIRDSAWDAVDISRKLHTFSSLGSPGTGDGTDVRQALEGLKPLLRRFLPNEVHVDVEIEDACPGVRMSPKAIDTMLIALASNARDAMPEGGTLRIAARTGAAEELETRSVVIDVEDDGTVGWDHGVDESLEPFFSTKDFITGTGLGLCTVRAFVVDAGGTFGVRPKSAGGTVVRMALPAVDPLEGT